MEETSIFKILYLYNLLLDGKYSKDEIICEFKKIDIELTKSTLRNYFKKLEENNVLIEKKVINKEKYYLLPNTNTDFSLTDDEIDILYEIKQLIFSQKNYRYIKILIDLFSKLSKHIKNKDAVNKLLNFEYFSKINWDLTDILEKHCETNDVLLLDYLLPVGANKLIEYQLKKLEMSKMNQRLYLIGILKDSNKLFRLPVDRIYRIKKVIKRNVPLLLNKEKFIYKVKKEAFDIIAEEENEKILKETEDTYTIEVMVDDEFRLIQRLLYFSCDLIYVSQGRIKNLLKEKLEMMKNGYDPRYIK